MKRNKNRTSPENREDSGAVDRRTDEILSRHVTCREKAPAQSRTSGVPRGFSNRIPLQRWNFPGSPSIKCLQSPSPSRSIPWLGAPMKERLALNEALENFPD